MPIPDPTTPGDGTTCQCHHGSSALQTPDLKPQSLSSGSGKNEALFLKTRSGNTFVLDDKKSTIRFQDKTGKSEFSLEGDKLFIKQKEGDITVSSEKETRFDCKSFEIHASNNISFNAGTDILHNIYSTMKIDSGKSTTISADKNVDVESYNSYDCKSMADTNISGQKKASICTKSGSMNLNALGKIAIVSAQDLGVVSKSMLSITGVMGCSFKSNDKVTLKAGGIIMGMAMAININ